MAGVGEMGEAEGHLSNQGTREEYFIAIKAD